MGCSTKTFTVKKKSGIIIIYIQYGAFKVKMETGYGDWYVIDKSIQGWEDGKMNFWVHRWNGELYFFSVNRETWQTEGGREGGGKWFPVYWSGEKRVRKNPRLPRQRLPQMILFSSCSLLFLHRFTSKGKAPHREQDVIGGLLSSLWTVDRYRCSPGFSCQEINMWHGISGGRRRHVGHEA